METTFDYQGQTMSVLHGCEIGQKLFEAGLIPENTRRIVVDIKHDEAVIVYYECYGDKAVIELTIEELIKNKDRLKMVHTKFACQMKDTKLCNEHCGGRLLGCPESGKLVGKKD